MEGDSCIDSLSGTLKSVKLAHTSKALSALGTLFELLAVKSGSLVVPGSDTSTLDWHTLRHHPSQIPHSERLIQ